MNTVRFVRLARAAGVLTLLLAGCDRGAAVREAPPLAGASIGGPFAMVDQDGHRFTDRQLAGRYRIMYFGYTSCPDVCPTDAQAIGAGLKRLEHEQPALAAKIVPVFVSVDPRRDTPAVLKQFVAAFHPRMVGLTGTPQAIAAVAKEYAVFYEKQPPAPGGGYMVQHSRVAYLMDPADKPVALIPVDKTPDAVAAELGRWVR
jgi:protein SCO1